jgi:uncharacterized repeat protein (TIGR03917 family)
VPPGSDLASLAGAARRLPAGSRFAEAFGDVETVLVYRRAGTAEPDPTHAEERAAAVPASCGPPDPRHPLAQVRAARGWSYQALARVVAKRAKALGVNMAAERQKVWRWEHRGVVPDRVTQLALAAELGVPPHLVGLEPWPAWLPTAPRPAYDRVAEDLTAEIGKGVRALAALGYTAAGGGVLPVLGAGPARLDDGVVPPTAT